MTHVEDRWHTRVDGKRVRSPRFEMGSQWRVRYIDPDGRERSRSFARKVDAERFRDTVAADVLRGTYIDPAAGSITLRAYSVDWMAGRVDLRPSTRELYRSHLDQHILPTLGAHRLGSLRRSDIRAAVNAWSAKLSPATVRTVFAVLSGILSSAVDDGLIARTPSTGTPLPRPGHRVLEPLAPASVLALANAITPRYRVAVFLGAGAGLRLGESLGLTASRVDFLRRRIAVEEQLQPLSSGGPGVLSPLKTAASRRVVPVDDLVLEELAQHIERFGSHESGVLITNRFGQTVRRSSFGNRWAVAVKAAGLPPGTRFHDLRHFYASTLIVGGLHPKAIQTRLGHSSIVETMDTYGHLFPEHEEAGRGVLDAALRPASDGPATAQRGEEEL